MRTVKGCICGENHVLADDPTLTDIMVDGEAMLAIIAEFKAVLADVVDADGTRTDRLLELHERFMDWRELWKIAEATDEGEST